MGATIVALGLPQMPGGVREHASTAVRQGDAVSRYGYLAPEAHEGCPGYHGSLRQERPSLSETLPAAEPLPHREITIHFDGSCLGNPGPGGYAAVLINTLTGARKEVAGDSGDDLQSTNSRMELMAAIAGLAAINPGAVVTMVGDSQYVVRNYPDYLPGWKAKGWKKSKGGDVLNVDLWQRLDALVALQESVAWVWEKGHAGHALNEAAHKLAHAKATALQRRMKA